MTRFCFLGFSPVLEIISAKPPLERETEKGEAYHVEIRKTRIHSVRFH